MAAITICSDFGAPKNQVWHCFHSDQQMLVVVEKVVVGFGSRHIIRNQVLREGGESESESCSVLSDSLWPHGLYYGPWNSPGQNTRVGSLSLPQGIFPTQGSNPGLPHCRWILYQLSHQGSWEGAKDRIPGPGTFKGLAKESKFLRIEKGTARVLEVR